MFRKIFVILLCCLSLLLCSCSKSGTSSAGPETADEGASAEHGTEDETSPADRAAPENESGSEADNTPAGVDAFMPFAKTSAAEYSYIEIVVDGVDSYREDGSLSVERLSDEDAEKVFALLKQIRIDSPPLNLYTWRESPDGGFGAIFDVCRSDSPYSDYVSRIRVIPSGSRLFLDSMCFPIDRELCSQLEDCYHELYREYFPDLVAKREALADES